MNLRLSICDKLHSRKTKNESRRWGPELTHTEIIGWHVLALMYYCCVAVPSCTAVLPPTPQNVRLLDLSYTFDRNTIYWISEKKLNFTITHYGQDPGKDFWYQSDQIEAGTHGGTHLDAPCHFAPGHWCISDIPLERLVVPVVVVDISNYVADNPNNHLSVAHLIEWEMMHGMIPDKSLLLIRTGWSKFWPNPLLYLGTTERKAELLRFPSIKPEVAKWLIENRNIVGIGIDVVSIDAIITMGKVHTMLLERNIYGLENVNMPHPLPATGMKAYVMPMKLKGASGAPCRLFVEVLEDVIM